MGALYRPPFGAEDMPKALFATGQAKPAPSWIFIIHSMGNPRGINAPPYGGIHPRSGLFYNRIVRKDIIF